MKLSSILLLCFSFLLFTPATQANELCNEAFDLCDEGPAISDLTITSIVITNVCNNTANYCITVANNGWIVSPSAELTGQIEYCPFRFYPISCIVVPPIQPGSSVDICLSYYNPCQIGFINATIDPNNNISESNENNNDGYGDAYC